MTDKRRRLASRVGLVVLVLAVGYSVYGQVSTQFEANQANEQKEVAEDEADAAQQDAKAVADPLYELCQRDAEVRRRVGTLCDTAAAVKDQPAPANGRDGADGRGIAGTAIVEGRLLITYTDGVVEDKGPITTAGAPGAPGKDGRSIIGTTIQDGALVLSYSDGTSETAGRVVGADGVDGRGISSVTVSADYRLIVTYTDGDTADVGPLPAGRDGRGIASIALDLDTCTATVTYTDGVTETKPMTGCPTDDPEPTDPNPAPSIPLPGG